MEITELKLSFYVDVLKRHWKAILAAVVVACALSLVYCQLAEKTYISKAALLPEEGEKSMSSPLNMLTANLGLGAQVKGKNSDLYLDVVKSRGFILTLLNEKYTSSVSKDVALDSFFNLRKYPTPVRLDALSKRLALALKVEKADNGIVNLQLETSDPVFSSDLLTVILKNLEIFFRDRDSRKMEKSLEFIKEKLDEKEKEFRLSADKVASFLSQNQYVDPLKTPRLYNVLEGLKRDERIQEEIYLLLYKEYEQSRIEKQKDKSVMQILDNPEPALEKDKPKRRKIMTLVFAVSLLLSYLVFALTDRMRIKA